MSLIIRNTDTRSGDYEALKDVPRPSHADWPARVRYGEAYDGRGGGMFSARLTAPLCAAGALALQWLRGRGVEVFAHILSVGAARDEALDPVNAGAADRARIEAALHGKAEEHHLGLANIVNRLHLIYGEQVQIRVDTDTPGETGVYLDIPQDVTVREGRE